VKLMMQSTTELSNDAMVRDFLAGWERRDTPFILDRFTDDASTTAFRSHPSSAKRP